MKRLMNIGLIFLFVLFAFAHPVMAGPKVFPGGIVDKTLDASKPVFTDGDKQLSSSGTVPVDQGGTGAASLTDHGVMLGSGTGPVTVTGPGVDGKVLVSNGPNDDPDWEHVDRQNQLPNTGWQGCSNASMADYSDSDTGFSALHPTSTCTDPDDDQDVTTGWNAENSATISSEPGGNSGNCLKILENGSDAPQVTKEVSVTGGKQYYFTFYHKDIDSTSNNPRWKLYDVSNAADIVPLTTETASAAWTQVTKVITAPSGCSQIRIQLRHSASNGDGDAYYFDDGTFSEVTAAFVAANRNGPDGWAKTLSSANLKIYRIPAQDVFTRRGAYYCVKIVNSSGSNGGLEYTGNGDQTKEHWLDLWRGRSVTTGVMTICDTAEHAYIRMYTDTGTYTDSDKNSGTSEEWIELKETIDGSSGNFNIKLLVHTGYTAYFYIPQMVYGSSIGEGNYAPRLGEWIYADNFFKFTDFNNTAYSDVGSWTVIDLESQSKCRIGKGIKAVLLNAHVRDSGSAANQTYMYLSGLDEGSSSGWFVPGHINDQKGVQTVVLPTDDEENLRYYIEASGIDTFDVYIGVVGIQTR